MSREYDALLLDLDGTLLTPDESIHPRTREAILEAERQGVEVMVVTGRSKIPAMPIVTELGLDAPTVLFNGCAVWCHKDERMLEERTIATRTLERLHGWAADRGAQVLVMTADEKLALEPRNEEEARNFEGFIGVQFVDRPALLRDYTIRLSFLMKCGETGSATVAAELEEAAGAPTVASARARRKCSSPSRRVARSTTPTSGTSWQRYRRSACAFTGRATDPASSRSTAA